MPLRFADLVQGSPQRRIGRDRPEQLALVAQRGQVRHDPAAIGDQHRSIGQHPAPVVHRLEVRAGNARDNPAVSPVRSASIRSAAVPA